MQFEFDEAKAQSNREKHGLSFELAAYVFADPNRIELPDLRRAYGEERFITIGAIQGRVVVVVYTCRDGAIRLISARKANAREQKKYHQAGA